MNLQGKNGPKKRKFSVDKKESKVHQKAKSVKLSSSKSKAPTQAEKSKKSTTKKTSMNLPSQKKPSSAGHKSTPTQTRQKAYGSGVKQSGQGKTTAAQAAMNLRKLEDKLDDDGREYVQNARRGIEERIQKTKIIAYCAVSGVFLLLLIIIFVANS